MDRSHFNRRARRPTDGPTDEPINRWTDGRTRYSCVAASKKSNRPSVRPSVGVESVGVKLESCLCAVLYLIKTSKGLKQENITLYWVSKKKKCLEAIFSIIKTIYNGYFFALEITNKVLSLSMYMYMYMYQIFSSLRSHLQFCMHFFFTFMEYFFCGHPI